MDALVRIDDVTRRYDGSGQPAVDGMTLEIAPGEAMAVTGASTSGKSTIPNLIADLDWPINGTITVDGRRMRPSSPKRSASMVALRAGHDRLILDGYSVGASGEQFGWAIPNRPCTWLCGATATGSRIAVTGCVTALRRCYRRPRITGRRPDLKERVQAMRPARRLPTEAQEALVIHVDRRTGDD